MPVRPVTPFPLASVIVKETVGVPPLSGILTSVIVAVRLEALVAGLLEIGESVEDELPKQAVNVITNMITQATPRLVSK